MCQGSVCGDKLSAKYCSDLPDQLSVMSSVHVCLCVYMYVFICMMCVFMCAVLEIELEIRNWSAVFKDRTEIFYRLLHFCPIENA